MKHLIPKNDYEPALLSVKDLRVNFQSSSIHANQSVEVIKGIDFDIYAGEKLALVGESGSGKSVTALSILQLHPPKHVSYPSGRICFQQQNLLQSSPEQLREIRGSQIAMIFQEPMTSLNPVYPIGNQLIEPLIVHQGMDKHQAKSHMIELLARTGIDKPDKRFNSFPHMLSGGQRQRVMIAMALACQPKLLIADEPTTALDVTIQAQIIELLQDLQQEFHMAILLITHDLNLVKHFADSVCVMKQGELVETASVQQLFAQPQHDYSQHLLNSQPQRLLSSEDLSPKAELLQATQIDCRFKLKSGWFQRSVDEIHAVRQVDIHLAKGETLGIVGESGSGKSTLGRCLIRLQTCQGDIMFEQQPLHQLSNKALRPLRRNFQIVFQDPYSSLSPRMTIEQIVGEGLQVHEPQLTKAQRRDKMIATLQEVDLDEEILNRYPHEFSGGQRQRIAIARALILEPKLIVLDEPTSALDVSIQKQVLALLRKLQQKHGMSYLFISHDLKTIHAISHRVMVMQQGQIVEQGETQQLFSQPQHPYTQRLLKAALFSL